MLIPLVAPVVLSTTPLPKLNITHKEREALNSLARDDSITILPADKGRMTVVLNTTDYKTKAKTLLSDEKTYKVLAKDPTPKYKSQVSKALQELRVAGSINDIQKRK